MVGGWVGGGGWWVYKVILVFRFGPRLGLKTEDLGQAEQFCTSKPMQILTMSAFDTLDFHFCGFGFVGLLSPFN